MASVNKVILIGNLGRDPEIRYMANGDAVANLALATVEKWKDKNNEKQEKTEWHRVVIYGKLAEVAAKYLQKGSAVYIEGKLQTTKWTDKSNVERYTTEINAFSMQMLGGKPAESREEKPASRPQQKPVNKPSFDDIEDDIPF